jgi:hypothetical protein
MKESVSMIEEFEYLRKDAVIDVDGDLYFYEESMEGILTDDDFDAIILDMMSDDERFYDEEEDDVV